MQGIYIHGICSGAVETPWEFGGKSGVTKKIRISTGSYENDYGEDEQTYVQIKIANDQTWARLHNQAKTLAGKNVVLKVFVNANQYDGKPPVIGYSVHKDANLVEISTSKTTKT